MIEAVVVDRDSQQKLYVQIYDIVKRKIEKGEWNVNSLIPSEDELCRMFSVSKATVRLAITDLVRDGYLKRQQGKGTYVKSSVPHLGMTIRTRFAEDTFGSGVRLERKIVKRTLNETNGESLQYLHDSGPVLHVQCRDTVNGEPVCCEDLYVSSRLVPGIEKANLITQPFFDAIQERALRKIAKVVQSVDVVRAKGDVAEYFGVKEGASAVAVYRIFIDADENTLAFMKLIGKVGKYKVLNEFELVRSK
ncbi:MAG: GntR family transcriptional regulator [Nitrospirae bacterium]|nr:MAG: GntR family transcriptional regulator [Nitrospirota bacterium]